MVWDEKKISKIKEENQTLFFSFEDWLHFFDFK